MVPSTKRKGPLTYRSSLRRPHTTTFKTSRLSDSVILGTCALKTGVYHAKARAFRHWLSHTEWERRENETYVFSVAKDTSLAGEEASSVRNRIRCVQECPGVFVLMLVKVGCDVLNGWYVSVGSGTVPGKQNKSFQRVIYVRISS